MTRSQWQGSGFCAIAVVVASLSATALLSTGQELLLAALLIVVLGVPHGAMDPIFARSLYRIDTLRGWLGFIALYLLLAALMVALWWSAAGIFLTLFLLCSILHFSGDLAPDTAPAARLLYGGAIIILPTLQHQEPVRILFAMLAEAPVALTLSQTAHWLAWPWLGLTLLAAAHSSLRNRQTGLEMGALCLLATLATPLLGFAVFFCAMHGARHVLRTQHYGQLGWRQMAAMATPPMLAVLVMGILVWRLSPGVAQDVRLVRMVFVALAALTVPHMALIERVRWQGWRPAGSTEPA